ncbi:MAG: WbuC family cupin fold metalloprotein, partial [Bacteroidales bacterium]|nr:WbuC family cupin fold metalloprotein [Bacteroidales bacterium]
MTRTSGMRNGVENSSSHILNALEQGTVMPIQRHHGSSETVVILRGKIRWIFYDDQGRITESTELRSDGDIRML